MNLDEFRLQVPTKRHLREINIASQNFKVKAEKMKQRDRNIWYLLLERPGRTSYANVKIALDFLHERFNGFHKNI